MLIVPMVLVNMVKAQESNLPKSVPKDAIMLNPIGILASLTVKDELNIILGYEHKIIPELSYLVHLNLSNVVTSGDEDKNGYTPSKLIYVGYGILPEIRFYPKWAPDGPFIGLYGKFMMVNKKYYESDILINTDYGKYVGIGGRVGFKVQIIRNIFEASVVFGKGRLIGFRQETNSSEAIITPNPIATFCAFEFKYGIMF